MAKILANERTELKQIYKYIPDPTGPYDFARNLAYELGESTRNNNRFDRALEKLVRKGILTKIYDFKDGDFREALYEFWNGKAQLEFFGTDHMNYRLFYCT